MKFLGEYSAETASAYREKFESEGIFPQEQEVGAYFGSSFVTMGTLRPRVRLSVEDADHQKALELIEQLEEGFKKSVEVDGKAADKVMLKVLIGILCLLGLVLYYLFSTGLSRI